MNDEIETVKIVSQRDDVVRVVRAWDVEAPDWMPKHKTRIVAPRVLTAEWTDGRLSRVGLRGPYRLKSGALSTEEGGSYATGFGWECTARMETISYVDDGTISSYTREDFPDWVWPLLDEYAPTL